MSDRLRHTRELLDAAVQMAMFIEMRFKHELACWRPADLSAQVQPMISTPGHGSLPSGHCTQSYVVLAVLKSLLRSGTDSDEHVSIDRQLERLAQRISTNRVVAGVHFPVDNLAGRALGQALGEYFVYLCHQGKIDPKDRSSKLWNFACFDGERVDGLVEFDPQGQPLIKATPEAGHSFYDFDDPIAVARNMDPVRARSLGIASAADLRHVARNLARNPGRTTQPPIQAPMLQELYEKAAAECDASGISFA